MTDIIEKIEMPIWLNNGNNFTFNLKEILNDSLYYPCARFDGNPVKHFMGNVYSFIYVDFDITKADLDKELESQKSQFCGYTIIHRESIPVDNFAIKHIWSRNRERQSSYIHFDQNNRTEISGQFEQPFCEWMIFERNENKNYDFNPKRFSLFYICAEATAAYKALYNFNRRKPKMIAFIQTGHNFIDSNTTFESRDGLFAKGVFKTQNQPKYIIHKKSQHTINLNWPEFNLFKGSIKLEDNNRFEIWGKTLLEK